MTASFSLHARPFARAVRVVSVLSILCSIGLCQDSLKSPVFRGYRPPKPGPLIVQSDVTYQLWQTFNLSQKANSGDVLAQHELGVRYLTGRGVQADTARGAFWIQKAAEQNMLPARFNYGILLFNGWGVPWTPFQAYDHFFYCAQSGMPDAEYVLAELLTDNLVVKRDWVAAFRWAKASADSGYAPAKELAEELVRRGKAPSASGKALEENSKRNSEDTSAVRTSANLAWSPVFLDFSVDTAGKVDDEMLLEDIRRDGTLELRAALENTKGFENVADSSILDRLHVASDAGSPEALVFLGRLYEKGGTVAQNQILAAAYYIRAIRAGSGKAPSLLWEMSEHSLSIDELRNRTIHGDADAMFVLAGLVGLGFSSPFIKSQSMLTETQALELLRSAASKGHLPSLIELGSSYYSGRWVDKDIAKSIELWRQAVAKGSVEAFVRILVANLAEGKQEPDSLLHHLWSAAGNGSVLAEVALGYCYETGIGITRNMGEAARFYRRAAERGSRDGFSAIVRLHDAIRPPEKRFEIGER